MSHANHTQDTTRALGTLFADTSIDQAARKVVRAAVTWGGLVVVVVDPAGKVTAHMAGMTATNRLVALMPWAVVGTYSVTSDDPKSAAMREIRAQIAEDIWHHWQLLGEAKHAA